MAANKTVSTINFSLSPHFSVTANIGYAHSLNIFCKTLGLTHVFPFRKTLFQKHLFCNTLFNGIFMKFNKNTPWHILYEIIKKEQQKLDLHSFATRFGIIIFPVLKKVKPKNHLSETGILVIGSRVDTLGTGTPTLRFNASIYSPANRPGVTRLWVM